MVKRKAKSSRSKKSRDVNFEVVVDSAGQSKSIFDEDAYRINFFS